MLPGRHSKHVMRAFCFSPGGGEMRAIEHALCDWDDLFAHEDAKQPINAIKAAPAIVR